MLIQSFWALAAAASFSTMAAFVKFPAMQPSGAVGAGFLPLSLFYPCLHLCSCPLNGYSLKTTKIKGHLIPETLLALLQLPFGSLLLENFLSEPTLR